jgi:hypothetical protein
VVSPWLTVSLTVAVALTSLSCSRSDRPAAQPSPSSVVASTPPFKTKEPDTYRAVRTVTFTPADTGQSNATTITIVRDGDRRREEDNSSGRTFVYLDLPTGSFVLVPEEKIYAEISGPATSTSTPEGFEEVYVHTAPIQSVYENLGTETINGTNTIKYKVTVNSANNGSVSQTETVIWIDEALGMPVKSVTRSAAGTRTMELSQISQSVDRALFEIPRGFQKVEMKVLQYRGD